MPKANINSMIALNGKTNEEFTMELKSFHSSHKTPFYREPHLLGRKVDLLKLYNTILHRGGFKKVTDEKAWSLIVEDLGLGRRCVNASLAVKQLYQRYLEPYERFHTHDEDGWPGSGGAGAGVGENDMEYDSEVTVGGRLRCGRYAPAPSECAVPMVYNENAHMIPPHMRHKWGLSTQLVELKDYGLLEKSLHSGLPNEVDFSLNTTLLMSSQPSGLNLSMNRNLVDLLLAHVGVFDEGCGSYLPIEPYWRQQDDRNMLRYWYENILEPEARVFLLPGIFSKGSAKKAETLLENIEAARRQLPLPVIYDLFNLRDDLTLPDTEGHRVFVVATALRNLALEEKCARVLAGHPQVLRFALLCGHARHAALRQLGQEMLALLRFPIKEPLDRYFCHILCQCVNDVDRTTRLRGLEMIARQCQLTDNRNFLSNDLPEEVYDAIISNLLVKDLHLVVNALEATYMLSTIGTIACERLISNDHCIPLLMSLLTIEAQAMGTDGLIRVKIMQGPTHPPVISQVPISLGHPGLPNQTGANGIGVRVLHGQTLMPPPPSVPRSGATVVAAGTVSAQSTSRHGVSVGVARFNGRTSSPQVVQQSPSGQSVFVPIAPKPTQTVPSTVSTLRPLQPSSNHSLQSGQHQLNARLGNSASSIGSVQNSQSSMRKSSSQGNSIRSSYSSTPEHPPHPHMVMHQYEHDPEAPTDRREFTLYWLRKYFEPYPQASVSRVHIYTEFQRAYSKQFQQLTNVTALEFHSCVKQAFPNVGQVKVQVPAGNVEIHYNHIKHVNDRPPSIQIPISVSSTGSNINSTQVIKKSGNYAIKSSSLEPTLSTNVQTSLTQKSTAVKSLPSQQNILTLSSQLTTQKHSVHSYQCLAHLNHTVTDRTARDLQTGQPAEESNQQQHCSEETEQVANSLCNALSQDDANFKSNKRVSPEIHVLTSQLRPSSLIDNANNKGTQQSTDNRQGSEKCSQEPSCNHAPQLTKTLSVQCNSECDTNGNGSHLDSANEAKALCVSTVVSSRSQECRKRSQPSPPLMNPSSPTSSPAPKRSRPNSTASCAASSCGSNLTEDSADCNASTQPRILIAGIPEPLVREKDGSDYSDRESSEVLPNGNSQETSTLSDTPPASLDSLMDDKSNGLPVTINGDEAIIRRVLNNTSVLKSDNPAYPNGKVDPTVDSASLQLSARHNSLVNGEAPAHHVNGIVKPLPALTIKSDQTILVTRSPVVAKSNVAESSESSSKESPAEDLPYTPVNSVAKDSHETKSDNLNKDPNTPSDKSVLSGTTGVALSVIKTVNVPPQAVLVASSSQCEHSSRIVQPPVAQQVNLVNSCQNRHSESSTTSLITSSSVSHQQVQKQTCPHNQVQQHIPHQHSCAHQTQHLHLNQPAQQQQHSCIHHAHHTHQQHQNHVQHQHQHNQNQSAHQYQQQSSTTAAVICQHQHQHQHQHHHCCHHNPQRQQQQSNQIQAKVVSGCDGELPHAVNGIVRVPVALTPNVITGSSIDRVSPSLAVSPPSNLPRSSTPSTVHSCSVPSPLNSKSSRIGAKARRSVIRKISASSGTSVSSSTSNVVGSSQHASTPAISTSTRMAINGHLCEWDGCKQVFDTCALLQEHVFSQHVPVTTSAANNASAQRYECLWANCERVPRGLYSLQGHVQDIHLSLSAQQQARLRRHQGGLTVSHDIDTAVRTIVNTTVAPSAIPSNSVTSSTTRCLQTDSVSLYPVDAAMQAIRRHTTVPDLLATESLQSSASTGIINSVAFSGATSTPWPISSTLREGPVTKHIRLTAALTLRNFVTYSDKAKAYLKKEESQLAELALSSMESSKTICQFLYLLNRTDSS